MHVACYSGPRTLEAGDSLRFDFRLMITPFRPLDTAGQWKTRYFHAFVPVDSAAGRGANTINVHHANRVNPWINYPFIEVAQMKAYVDSAHARGMKAKIYYTVRELSNRAPELFALRSLGDEVLSLGPGGGHSWLQEHLGGDYLAAWHVPENKDAAVVNSGVSRWHNYYVEGLDWLVKHVKIDGLYIDDVAFDRTTMKRVRKVLDRGNPGALIDLHSANQYNPRDGFASSANLYLEHFPFLDRLWFGEYFDYDAPPDYWLVEVSGIPFGLMGEMLEKGGNPWRGMTMGMTARLPWSGDPAPLWKVWDSFGIQRSRMIGWWSGLAPVMASDTAVKATTWVRPGRAMVSLGSWRDTDTRVTLRIDWKALGLDPARTRVRAPAIAGFQEAREWRPGGAITLPAKRGIILLLEGA
ncbi:MAG: glycoside hydrolase domain-containing protein [Gemmatimonadota bacterium]